MFRKLSIIEESPESCGAPRRPPKLSEISQDIRRTLYFSPEEQDAAGASASTSQQEAGAESCGSTEQLVPTADTSPNSARSPDVVEIELEEMGGASSTTQCSRVAVAVRALEKETRWLRWSVVCMVLVLLILVLVKVL